MSLFKLQYSLPGVFDNNPYKNTINGSLWSLAYEVTCYLTVLIAGIAGFIERRAVFLALSSGGIFCSIIIIEVSQHAELILLAQVFIPFCIGSLLYVFKDFIKMNLFTALSLVLLAIVFSETFLSFFTLMLFVSYSVIYLGFSRSKILFSYNRLGDYSYGFYIYAFPIQQIFASYGISDPFSNIALAAPVTLFFSILSWHFVEYPFLKFKRYFIDRSAI